MQCSPSNPMIGTRPTVEMTFTDTDGDPADPTSITIRVKAPDRTVTVYTTPTASITNPGPVVGTWEFFFPVALDQAGDWWVYAVGSGGGADVANEIKIPVRGTHVPLA